MLDLLGVLRPLAEFFTGSRYARQAGYPDICDFVAGNPQELALPGFVEALQQWSLPRDRSWFAYAETDPAGRKAAAAGLRDRTGIGFRDEDLFLTNGAFAGLAVVLRTVVDPGDEVVFFSPPWFFYEGLIVAAGASPTRVYVRPPSFEPRVEDVAEAITSRTRAVIVNTPNNPTGRMYTPEFLEALAALLRSASERNGRPIHLISDESYNRIVFDGRRHHSPTGFYPRSFLIYTYGKTLLTPGQRLGYVALPPDAPDRDELATAILAAQLATGYAVPNRLLMHALPDLEPLSIDIPHLQEKRDRMVAELRMLGYQVNVPDGTFYLLPRSPVPNDQAFVDWLADENVFVLAGRFVELPGYFRISLTANDDMIERSLPGFAAAMERAAVPASR